LEKAGWNRSVSGREKRFQLDAKRLLKSLSKAGKTPSHEKTEKAFLRGQERERNMVALLPFLRERWRYRSPTVFYWLAILFQQ
jgi:hypothetical protein